LFGIRIENRVVKVDTSEPLERDSFGADQVTYP
jgi:hypothetical protein